MGVIQPVIWLFTALKNCGDVASNYWFPINEHVGMWESFMKVGLPAHDSTGKTLPSSLNVNN